MFETLKTAYRKDPALKGGLNILEVVLYPGIHAIYWHKLSHLLYSLGLPFFPRLFSEFARFYTHIEIHPGAKIGKRFFIDHGAGIIIGETSEIGDDVMLYQEVTLGGHGWWADAKGKKRHPTIEDGVTVGVGAKILGPVRIGENSKIGAMALVINDVPPNSTVVGELGKAIIREGQQVKKVEVHLLPNQDWFKGEYS